MLFNFTAPSGTPLVEPPPLPSLTQTGGLAHDQPLEVVAPQIAATPKATDTLSLNIPEELIKTCTPDCTSPHCTIACKCLNTHNAVEFKCNPPIIAEYNDHCRLWYLECPMFKPLNFEGASNP